MWHYQHFSNDQWDLDWVFERQIATVRIGGRNRKVVMNIGKMGILEAVDAATGEYLFSIDAGTQNVITAIDPVTGAKTIDPSTPSGSGAADSVLSGPLRRSLVAANILQQEHRPALCATDGMVHGDGRENRAAFSARPVQS